jgi:biotin carboxylase
MGVFTADRLARALGLPGNSPESSAGRRNKAEMQKALADAGLRHIQWGLARTVDEAVAFGRELGTWPVVVKPLEGAATVGVHFCCDNRELAMHAQNLLSSKDVFGQSNLAILVQEFISGTEFVVNTISCAGRHQMTDMWVESRIPVGAEGNALDSVKLITRLEPGHHELIAYAFAVLSALEFSYGPSHMEIIVDTKGPVLIEVGARPMGGDFPEELLRECLEHHLVDRALLSYLDPDAFERLAREGYRPKKSMMVKYFIAPENMTVNAAPALPLIAELPSVRRVEYSRTMEEKRAVRTVDMITAPGHVLLCHENESALMEDYRLIRNIETRYFSMLFEDSAGFTPVLDAERMQLALSQLAAYQEQAKGCLVVLDNEAESPVLEGVSVVAFDAITALRPDVAYEKILLHNGNRVVKLSEYCARLKKLVQHLKKDGALYITPWGLQATMYGRTGMAIIFRLLGLRLQPPLNRFADMLWGSKE